MHSDDNDALIAPRPKMMQDNTVEATWYLLVTVVTVSIMIIKDTNRYKSHSMIVTRNPERNHDIELFKVQFTTSGIY